MKNWMQLVNPLRWKRSFLISIAALFLVVWFGFLDTYSVMTRIRLSSQKRELKYRTEQLKLQIEELEAKIAKLENDPDVIERIARENYGMRKKGEIVYRIQEK